MSCIYEHLLDQIPFDTSNGILIEWYVHDYDAKDKTQQLELHFMYDADARRFETSVLPIIRQYYQQS